MRKNPFADEVSYLERNGPRQKAGKQDQSTGFHEDARWEKKKKAEEKGNEKNAPFIALSRALSW